jgi:hypothetical protein
MKIVCMCCREEVSLDHAIFHNYEGPVKCFFCGAVMDVGVSGGVLESMSLNQRAWPALQGYASGLGQGPGAAKMEM